MRKADETLGSRLQLAMDHRGIKQVELAKQTGMRQPNVSKLIRGETTKTTAIARLASALRVPVAWLELGEGPAPDFSAIETGAAESATVPAKNPVETLRELAGMLREVPKEGRASVARDLSLLAQVPDSPELQITLAEQLANSSSGGG